MDKDFDSTYALLQNLLVCGLRADYEAIRVLPGAGVHREVVHLADGGRNAAREFFDALSVDEQVAMMKAVAVYEDTVGGVGSVTLLERFASLDTISPLDPRRIAYEWILSNTSSYGYCANGRKSLESYERMKDEQFRIAENNRRRDALRQAEDQKRVAARATGNLYGAVRRGDLKAVLALIERGADRRFLCPDGSPLSVFARLIGRLNIAMVLEAEPATERHTSKVDGVQN